MLIEQAEALGEPSEDPLLLFSILYGFWAANFNRFQRAMLVATSQRSSLKLAEKQAATVPLMIGHRIMGPVPVVHRRPRERSGAS